MKKKWLFLFLSCMTTLPIINTVKSETNSSFIEMSEDCVEPSKPRYERNIGWVVDFTNHCNRNIKVFYEYYNGEKWVTNAVFISAEKTVCGRPAGEKGIKNIEWEYN